MLMADYWHDAQLASHFSDHDASALGQGYLMNAAGQVTLAPGHPTTSGVIQIPFPSPARRGP
jgi:hypothetical protein